MGLSADDKATQIEQETVSGIELNKNRFFRFNNSIKLSFDASLQKGYQQYLEYLVRITDINKQEINVILSLQNDTPSELLIISKDKLSKHAIGISKDEFLNNVIPFNFIIDLKSDQLTIGIKDTVLIENRLGGLKSHTDYKIVLGTVNNRYNTNQNTLSSIKLSNISSDPDLTGEKEINESGNSTLLWVIIIVILDILIFAYIIIKKRKQKILKREQQAVIDGTDPEDDNIIFHPEIDINEIIKVDRSAVFLFKQFEVLDKERNDISFRFTPLLKELFLILLLFSQKDSKGISTGLLRDLLWFDKELQSANNNRAVNIGKLKGILDAVGDMK